MVTIRLARGGAKTRPFFHVVVTDSRNRRDGRYIERIGFFNPVAVGEEVRLKIGRISGAYGIRGWVRVYSYTHPRENIVQYQPWYLKDGAGNWQEKQLAAGSRHGKGVVARLAGCENRDQALDRALVEKRFEKPRWVGLRSI